jgi:lysyl-tRNA synthetase class 1
MDELDELEDVHFGKRKVADKKERAKLRGLYTYCWMLKPPAQPGIHIPYNLLTYLAKVAPKGSEKEFIADKLRDYGYIKRGIPEKLERRIGYALNWIEDFMEIKEKPLRLEKREISAIKELIQTLQVETDEEEIHGAIFAISRKHGVPPRRFFKILYTILIGVPKGPRLGPYIVAMGRKSVIDALRRALKKT